tara:strand:- start:1378 stop:1551 length:174 start_codon:yes stop_codon:yes gene_type:complete
MFNFLKKKSKLELLNEKYQKLQKEAFELSSSNRTKSDEKYTQADEVLKQIEQLKVSE